MGDRDLVAVLRAFDADLSARAPGPRLQVRLFASLRARAGARRWPPGGDVARLGWPLGLAAATAAAAIAWWAPAPGERAMVSGDPQEIVGEKIHADAGPADPASRRGLSPPIHAPGLREPPVIRELHEAPRAPVRRPAAPDGDRSHPTGAALLPGDPPAAPAGTRSWVEAPRVALGTPSGGGAIDPAHAPSRPAPVGGSSLSASDHARSVAPAAPLVTPPVPSGAPAPIDPSPCLTREALELSADAACQASGLVPSTYELLDPCGDDTYRSVDPKCVPPPDTSSPTCTGSTVGDGSTCADPASLHAQAEALCEGAGLSLAYFYADPGPCGAQVSVAKYVCCPATPPAPPVPPTGCSKGELDVTTCSTHDALAEQAGAQCGASGGSATDLSFAHDCADGSAMTVLFTCCAPGSSGP